MASSWRTGIPAVAAWLLLLLLCDSGWCLKAPPQGSGDGFGVDVDLDPADDVEENVPGADERDNEEEVAITDEMEKDGFTRGFSAHRFDLSGCTVCNQHPPESPRLFVEGRPDGLGSNVEGLLFGMAIAMRHGLNFGGAIHYRHNSHRLDIANVTAAFFDIDVSHLFSPDLPVFHKMVSSVGHIQTFMALRKPSQAPAVNILLQAAFVQMKVQNYDEYITPSFVSALRAQVVPSLRGIFDASRVRRDASAPFVALHVRRGDVNAHLNPDAPGYFGNGEKSRERWTPNEWYYDVVEKVRARLPGAEVHVWSSMMTKYDVPAEGGKNATWFDGFRERGMEVHLDTDELESWAHMALADVFVMAKSSFSWVPAVVSSSCTLYQPWAMRMCVPLHKFTRAPYPEGPSDSELAQCLNHTLSPE